MKSNVQDTTQYTFRAYVVSWLKHSRESNRPVPGPKHQEGCVLRIPAEPFQKKNATGNAQKDTENAQIDM